LGLKQRTVSSCPFILDAAKSVNHAYSQFGEATETLVTKALLGTFGCLPACDQYFIAGFRGAGLGYSYLNTKFVEKVLAFSCQHLTEFRREQELGN
jgi:hypothetical protein